MAEHNTLTGSSLHEPKGLAALTAPTDANKVYMADGAGSGIWQTIPSATHGEMIVESYATGFSVPLAVDPTLATDTDYVKVTAAGMWTNGHLSGVTFNVDELVVPIAGDYEVNFWASVEVSVINTKISVKYAVDDSTPYSTRKILAKAKVAGDIQNIGGIGIAPGLTAGQTISLYIAADKACTIIGREAGMTLKLLDRA